MSSYQSDTVHPKEWLARPQSVVIKPTLWPASINNPFTAQATPANPLPLLRTQLQILTAGIVLDQELIAECRSGEI